MRLSALCREAWRDISTGTARVARLGAALMLVVVGLTLLDLATIRGFVWQANQFRTSLATVTVLEAEGRIDGVTCEALGQLPGTTAAALRTLDPPLKPARLPATSVQTFETTASIAKLLQISEKTPSGVYASAAFAEALGAAPGQLVEFATGQATVAGVYTWDETDGRRPGYGYSVLVPTAPDQPFDACWVETWPSNPDIVALSHLAVLPSGEDEHSAQVSQLNTSLGTHFDGPQLFTQRLTRYVPFAVAGFSLLLGILSVRLRKLEIASDLHAGVRYNALALKHLLEAWVWVMPCALGNHTAAALFAQYSQPGDKMISYFLAWTHIAVCLAGVSLGVLLTLALVRERYLIRYFTTRH